MTTSAVAVAARLVESSWVVAPAEGGTRLLHHPVLDGAGLRALLEAQAAGTVLLAGTACGKEAPLAVPSVLDATTAPRCSGCSAALGMPPGTGAPAGDPGCARVLDERLGRIR